MTKEPEERFPEQSSQEEPSLEAQLVWSEVPAVLVFMIFPIALMFALVMAGPLDFTIDDDLERVIFLVILYLTLAALLSLATYMFTDSWRLRLGTPIDRASLGLAMLIGLSLFCVSCLFLISVYLPLLYAFPELLDWLSKNGGIDDFSSPERVEFLTICLGLVVSVVLAPIVEELIFRGYLLHHLILRIGVVNAVILSSFIFGMFHYDPIGTTIKGVILCCVTLYSRSLLGPITAHGCNNLLAETLPWVDLVIVEGAFFTAALIGSATALLLIILVWRNRSKITPTEWASPFIERSNYSRRDTIGAHIDE